MAQSFVSPGELAALKARLNRKLAPRKAFVGPGQPCPPAPPAKVGPLARKNALRDRYQALVDAAPRNADKPARPRATVEGGTGGRSSAAGYINRGVYSAVIARKL